MLNSILSWIGMAGVGAILVFIFSKTSNKDKIEVQQKVDKVENEVHTNDVSIEKVKQDAKDEKAKDISKEQLVDFFNNYLNKP